MTLLERIRGPAEGFEGVLGVSVKHLGTGEAASFNGDELFPTASVFKVPVIVELYRQVEAGAVSLDDEVTLKDEDKVPGSGILKELSPRLSVSLRDLAKLMMIVSDNTATDLVVETVGMENINATLRRLGLERTKVVADCRDILFDLIGLNEIPDGERTLGLFEEKARETEIGGSWSLGVEENDVTTPNEMLRLLEMLVSGEAASRESCDAILETMSRCQTGGYRMVKYLPRGEVEVAHKTGSLPGIRNDAGVVTLLGSGERYILSCFTKGVADNYAAEEAIAKVSKNVYDHFTS
ncbi:MAG: serine hydrolase [Candidatus Bathyarchaeia archaeon]